jgi:hypothetical protein
MPGSKAHKRDYKLAIEGAYICNSCRESKNQCECDSFWPKVIKVGTIWIWKTKKGVICGIS